MVEEIIESVEYSFEPIEGEKLEMHNVRKVYTAEMSSNKKLLVEATKQSTATLVAQRVYGRQAIVKARD